MIYIGSKAVTAFVKFLKTKFTTVPIYKDDDRHTDVSEYIAVNHLPWVYGKPLNDQNAINVNIHVSELSTGGANRVRMNEILDTLMTYVPVEPSCEGEETLEYEDYEFCISSISSPIEDTSDKTYFYNVRIQVKFIQL